MFRRFGPIVIIGLFAAIAAQQGSLVPGTCGNECSERCPDDAAPNHCPPGCTGCVCVGPAVATGGERLVATPLRLVVACVERLEGPAPAEPPPETIFHVPRRILG